MQRSDNDNDLIWKELSTERTIELIQSDHPWMELPESSLDEDLRYTLDEMRFS